MQARFFLSMILGGLLLLLLTNCPKAAELSEFQKAEVVGVGSCEKGRKLYLCFHLIKEGKKYLTMGDKEGPVMIFLVNVFKESYTPQELRLVWARTTEKDDV